MSPEQFWKNNLPFMLKICEGREMVRWIDSSLVNTFLPLLLNTGQLHTIWRKADVDEFQGRLDGDEYHQNGHKCNFSCVLFFTESLLYHSKNYFTVSVINPFWFFCLTEYCFSNPQIFTNDHHLGGLILQSKVKQTLIRKNGMS